MNEDTATSDDATTEEAGPPPRRALASRTLAVNAASNWALMGVNLVVRIFLLAYLFQRLGREEYGVYQVAMAVTGMTYFLRFGLVVAVVRVVGEDIAARDWDRLAQTLSVVRTLVLALGALAWGVAVVASVFFLDALGVPETSRDGAALLVQLAGLSAACNIVDIVYMGTLRAAQRYYLSNAVLAGMSLLRVALVVAAFSLGWGSLAVLGACMAVPDVMGVTAMAAVRRRLLPQVRLSLRRFSREAFRRVMGFSLWLAVGEIAWVVHANIAVPLVSAVFGAAVVPTLVVPRQLAAQMGGLVGGFTAPVRPLATQFAVEGRREQLGHLYRTTLRFTGLLVVPATAVLLVYGKAVIRILTDAQMAEESYAVLVAFVGLFGLTLLGHPGISIITGISSVRGLTLSSAGSLLVGIGLGAGVALWTDAGVLGLVVALNVPILFYRLGYVPWRVQRDIGVSVAATFARGLLPPLLVGIVPLGLGIGLQWIWPVPETGSRLVQFAVVGLQATVCGGVYLVAAWLLIMDREERTMFRRLLPGGRRG